MIEAGQAFCDSIRSRQQEHVAPPPLGNYTAAGLRVGWGVISHHKIGLRVFAMISGQILDGVQNTCLLELSFMTKLN
jgi:hypothetical protein